MITIDYDYYVGMGDESSILAEATTTQKDIITTLRKELVEDYGAESFVVEERTGRLLRIVYKGQSKLKCLRDDLIRNYTDGSVRHTYVPNRSYKRGQELHERMKKLAFSESSFILKRIGVSRMVLRAEWNAEFAKAFIHDGMVFLCIPITDDKRKAVDPYPKIPNYFKHLKPSEFFALLGQ